MLKKLFSKEVILYLIFGILTTLVDYIIFYLANDILKIHYIIATCLAWFIAVLFAYFTNKNFVFSSEKGNKEKENKNNFREIFYFFSARVLSLIFTILFMFIMVDLLKINEYISKILVSGFVVVANYFFSKLFIFKK